MSESITIPGFDIQMRELTEEEANREITLDRFSQFHYDAGEDFIDSYENCVNTEIFCGWCLHKFPDKSAEILEIANGKQFTFGVQSCMDLYDNHEAFYEDFATFLNLTSAAKKRVNQVLIQVEEYYNPTPSSDSKV